jgi:hypothetical protein
MHLPIGTATAYAADTLHAPIVILRDHTRDGVRYADVETIEGGVGGWATPGKRLTVRWDILRDYRPVTALDIVDAISDTAAQRVHAVFPTLTGPLFEAAQATTFSRLFRDFLAQLDATDPAGGVEFRTAFLAQFNEVTGE